LYLPQQLPCYKWCPEQQGFMNFYFVTNLSCNEQALEPINLLKIDMPCQSRQTNIFSVKNFTKNNENTLTLYAPG